MCRAILLILILATGLLAYPAAALPQQEQPQEQEPGDIIVDKNLFSPDRTKWVMDRPRKGKKEAKTVVESRKLASLELYGTIMAGERRYAVMRTQKPARGKSRGSSLYMPGDYAGGYLIKEIGRRKVVLQDEGSNEEFEIYINEGKKDRSAVKTEIRQAALGESEKGRTSKESTRKKSIRKVPRPKKAQTSSSLRKMLKRDLRVLKSKNSTLVRKQAERDYKKLEKLLPFMSDKERSEVSEMKKQLDQLIR